MLVCKITVMLNLSAAAGEVGAESVVLDPEAVQRYRERGKTAVVNGILNRRKPQVFNLNSLHLSQSQ